MSPKEEPARVSTITSKMGVDPGDCVSHVLHLFAPGNFGLEPVVNHRHADSLARVESTNVPIHVRAAHPKGFVARIQPAAMHENKDRPLTALRQKQVEP